MQEEKHKRCFKCGEIKPLSDFYKHSQMADGHVNKCKECNKKDVKENRTLRIDYYQEYDKVRGKDKLSPRMTNRKQRAVAKGRSSIKNPFKVTISPELAKKATTSVSSAVKCNRLEKSNYCFCCGSQEHVHGHHSSYSEDMWLMVTWLCASCHSRLHADFEFLTGAWREGVYKGFL